MSNAILVIDDDADHCSFLANGVLRALERRNHGAVVVLQWSPGDGEEPLARFENFLKEFDVRLVITDYDLTAQGTLGLFGATVVDWCQLKALPVGDFSRKNVDALAKEPNLFELRIHVAEPGAAEQVAELYLGFEEVREAFSNGPDLSTYRNPAAALATILSRRGLTPQFSQYGSKYASANASLVDSLRGEHSDEQRNTLRERFFVYIAGHILVNSILRFPGPLVNRRALAAYLAVSINDLVKVEDLFGAAIYRGPFSGLERFWWVEDIDDVLDTQREKLDPNAVYVSAGAERRQLAELAIGERLELDSACDRCGGEEGGLFCPYTDRTVCERGDCSTPSSTWIPQGARLCRLEYDFYEEWAPILGM
ncbi:hypothetical protein XA1311A_19460 [Xanthomonas arboricola]|uniref:hypothetical protein n=1 Tax=Xanthomonas arboricola TaxID=56448 RepID=UPI001E42E3FC|nr:hypothetical protein [Xanthomonas arboricola]CAE6762268.1 hypothetical protein XA1311A_19460 [Xanthomonas arboricola]CAE6762283.1 hypothetical protein XA1311A_19460 [Xanthomonas arboricola]